MSLSSAEMRKLAKLGASLQVVAYVAELMERNGTGETLEAPKHETPRKRKPRVSSTARVRKYREKLKIETPVETQNETPKHVSETQIPPAPPSLPTNETPPKEVLKQDKKELGVAREPRKVGTRLAPDFEPDESCVNLARELHYNRGEWKARLANFKDYWAGVPGTKGTKLDWQATFRNALRNGPRNGNGNAKGNANGTQHTIRSSLEQAIDHINSREESLEAGSTEGGRDDLRVLP